MKLSRSLAGSSAMIAVLLILVLKIAFVANDGADQR